MFKRVLALLLVLSLCLVPITASAGDLLYGDANDDGQINMKDVLTERKFLADIPVEISATLGDCNGDGAVNMKDVLILRQYLADIIDRIEGKTPVYTKKSLRSIYFYDSEGTNTEINFFTYDAKGGLTLKTDREPDGTLIWKKEYTYDTKHRNTLCVYTDALYDDKSMTALSYNTAGKLSAITRTNESGDTLRKETLEYNTSGQCVGLYSFDKNGKADGKTLYSYDSKKRLVKQEVFGADGTSYGYSTYEYNSAGNTSRIKRYDGDGTLVGSEEFVYDAAGNLETHVYNDSEGLLDAKVTYTYNTTRRLAQDVPYSFMDEYTTFTFVYAQKNPPVSATCVMWNGDLLWSQKYNYIDVE